MRNEGARCSNCKYNGGLNKKACRRCMNREGKPGWEPAEGVKTRMRDSYICKLNRWEKIREVLA